MRYRPVADRFWEKVDKQGEDECWNWIAAAYRCGYGALNIKGNKCSAHRVSWELHNGSIPLDISGDTLHVLHTCDNRLCVNPKHLFLGTHADNMQDMMFKGRGSTRFQKGKANHRAILTEELVLEIKLLLGSNNVTQRAITKKYGVAYQTIHNISSGRCWNNI